MTKAFVIGNNLLYWSPAVEDLGQKRSKSQLEWKRKPRTYPIAKFILIVRYLCLFFSYFSWFWNLCT